MTDFVVLLRGINVGGQNKVPMAALRELLEAVGFERVTTYIASGNALVSSGLEASEVQAVIEAALPTAFVLDPPVRVLALPRSAWETLIADRPVGFGDEPASYNDDAIFLLDGTAEEAITAFDPREGVDTVWAGTGVIYSRRVTALRTKSRLSQVLASPVYRSMTIRNWKTVVALDRLLRERQ